MLSRNVMVEEVVFFVLKQGSFVVEIDGSVPFRLFPAATGGHRSGGEEIVGVVDVIARVERPVHVHGRRCGESHRANAERLPSCVVAVVGHRPSVGAG